MLSKETMSVNEYEKNEAIVFHYNREDRLSRKRKRRDYIPQNNFSSFVSHVKGKKPKRNFILALNLGLLIIAAIIFFSYQLTNPIQDSEYANDYLKIKMTSIKIEDDTLNVYLHFTNTSKIERKIKHKKDAIINLKNGAEIVHSQAISLPEIIMLGEKGSENSNSNFSFPINITDAIIFNKITLKLYLNNKKEISLEEKINFK